MEIAGTNIKYKGYRMNAYWYNAHLDTMSSINQNAVDAALEHLKDCKKNPNLGLLARKRQHTNFYPQHRIINKKDLMKNPTVKAVMNCFDQKFYERLYPQTARARKFLVDREYVVLDYVKPRVNTLLKKIFKLLKF